MNRTLRWLHRTRLNREQFYSCLRKKRAEQLDKDQRKYLKHHSPLDMTMIRNYLEENSIPYKRQRSMEDDTLVDYNECPPWFSELYATGVIFSIGGVEVTVKNFVYYVKRFSFRTFTCIRIGDECELKNWAEEDILSLIPQIPSLLKPWNEEDIQIDKEFQKRDKIKKLKLVRERILTKIIK